MISKIKFALVSVFACAVLVGCGGVEGENFGEIDDETLFEETQATTESAASGSFYIKIVRSSCTNRDTLKYYWVERCRTGNGKKMSVLTYDARGCTGYTAKSVGGRCYY